MERVSVREFVALHSIVPFFLIKQQCLARKRHIKEDFNKLRKMNQSNVLVILIMFLVKSFNFNLAFKMTSHHV